MKIWAFRYRFISTVPVPVLDSPFALFPLPSAPCGRYLDCQRLHKVFNVRRDLNGGRPPVTGRIAGLAVLARPRLAIWFATVTWQYSWACQLLRGVAATGHGGPVGVLLQLLLLLIGPPEKKGHGLEEEGTAVRLILVAHTAHRQQLKLVYNGSGSLSMLDDKSVWMKAVKCSVLPKSLWEKKDNIFKCCGAGPFTVSLFEISPNTTLGSIFSLFSLKTLIKGCFIAVLNNEK